MTTRRRFIASVPLAGAGLLAACGDKAAAPAATPAPAAAPSPAPSPSPAPAPQAAAPAAPAAAAAGPVEPTEAVALALGYVTDTNKADATKFKAHNASQACSNCALFGGKTGDTTGPCPLVAGRAVAAKGWCSGYAKKA